MNTITTTYQSELAPLLLVPLPKKSRGSNSVGALLVVSATVATAAMTVLLHCCSSTGVNLIA